jgi:hypothetical protein
LAEKALITGATIELDALKVFLAVFSFSVGTWQSKKNHCFSIFTKSVF